MKIYLDFDGTVVEHQYPKIGRCNYGCMEVIKKLQDAGHTIILNTYRAECNDGTLEAALNFINEDCWMLVTDRTIRDTFELQPIKNCDKKISPAKFDWDYIKSSQTLFIDDQAYGTPLKPAVMTNGRMVDWDELDKQFEFHGMYKTISN